MGGQAIADGRADYQEGGCSEQTPGRPVVSREEECDYSNEAPDSIDDDGTGITHKVAADGELHQKRRQRGGTREKEGDAEPATGHRAIFELLRPPVAEVGRKTDCGNPQQWPQQVLSLPGCCGTRVIPSLLPGPNEPEYSDGGRNAEDLECGEFPADAWRAVPYRCAPSALRHRALDRCGQQRDGERLAFDGVPAARPSCGSCLSRHSCRNPVHSRLLCHRPRHPRSR